MRIFAAACIALLLASGGAAAEARDKKHERYKRALGKPVANPSAIVKAELSFARLAREEGQWTAFRETAADDAIMFVPNITNAQLWLKSKADPASAVEWQPHKITMSCDGSLAISTGAWQGAEGTSGYFTTIWRQEDFGTRKRGKAAEWKWVFDHGAPLDKPLAEPDFIETKLASCKAAPAALDIPATIGMKRVTGSSVDGSLVWGAAQHLQDAPALTISIWDGEKRQMLDHGSKKPLNQ